MNNKKVSTKELINVNSKFSSMRWGFILIVKASVMMLVISVVASLVASFLNAFLPPANAVKIDLGGIALILGGSVTGSFVGKAGQSFAEGKYNSTVTSEAPEVESEVIKQ